MRAIMLMFDSLNRHHLPPYGCDWVHARNLPREIRVVMRRGRDTYQHWPLPFKRTPYTNHIHITSLTS